MPSFFWSDSTLVLQWLGKPPNTWKTFIANRVSEIQSLTARYQWSHTAGRGISVNDFSNSILWRHDPKWLEEDSNNWPVKNFEATGIVEELEPRKSLAVAVTTENDAQSLNSRYSSLMPCLRFASNCRTRESRTLLP